MATCTTIVLAGGVGSRMRPLSNDITKAMISFAGRPLLDQLLFTLRKQGFTDVVLASAGKRGEVYERYGDGRAWGSRIRYVEPGPWRGTAACARGVIEKLGRDVRHPVLVVYGDSLLQADLRRMMRFHTQRGAAATVLCHRPRFDAFLYHYHDRNPAFPRLGKRTNYGIVEVGQDGRVVRVEEKPLLRRLDAFQCPMANAAAYILEEAAWEHVPRRGWCDFPQDLFPRLLKHELPCWTFDIGAGYRLDLGTLPTYYAAHMAVLRGRIAVEVGLPARARGLWVGSRVVLRPRSHVGPSAILGEDTVIGAGARVVNSVLGKGVTVGAGARVSASVVLDGAVIDAGAVFTRCIAAPGAFIGAGVRLPPGTVVGPPCHIASFDCSMRAAQFDSLLRSRPRRPTTSRARRR
jgi:mannose-1-phosphate guanylyltransferase